MGVGKELSDHDEEIRNIVARALLLVGVYSVIFFFTIALIVFLVNGREAAYIFVTTSQPLHIRLMMAAQTALTFLMFWINQVGVNNFTGYDYFAVKYWGSFIVMFGVSTGILVIWWREFLEATKFFERDSDDIAEKIYGDAHWATEEEIKKAGLFAKEGMLLGKYDAKRFLVAGGFEHTLLFAPTGSGKGVGFVVPNLLFWSQSVIVHDIKGENYELTSGYRFRVMKQKVFVWNPTDQEGVSHCYNPLDWISKKPGQMVDDVQKIANFLLPKQDFWNNEARALITGLMLYLTVDDTKVVSLGEVVRTIRSDDLVYNLAVVLDTLGNKIHPVAYMNLAAFLQKAEKERSGVSSTASSSMELWSNPLIDTTTASSDFNLGLFKITPHSLFVCVTPENLARLQPLMQIFYQQASAVFTAHMPLPNEKIGVLMLMDEFTSMGKMEQFQTGIAYYRGYKVRLFLIVQDTQQLKGVYEDTGMNSFLSNSKYRITFAANNVDTARFISDLLGNQTVLVRDKRTSFKFVNFDPGGAGQVDRSYKQKALLAPQEVIGLPREEQIIIIEATPPIKTKKIRYYQQPFFTKRLMEKTDVPTQKGYDMEKFRHKKKDEGGASGSTATQK